jgi:S-DNA-T family DNA segregation ATPase FtsK/SpoIIIE
MTTIAGPPGQRIHRHARLRPPPVPDGAVIVAMPPRVDSTQAGAAGWLQYLFPVVGSLGGMLFIVNNPKPLFVASGLLFMLGSVGMGVGMGVQQRLAGRRRTDAARAQYLDYLGTLRLQLQATAASQRAWSAWRYPAPDALLGLIRSSVRLWERRPADPDFLQVRVGAGRQPLATPLQVPAQDGLAQAPDPVCVSAAGDLVEAHSWVVDDAIGVDLKTARVVTIVGPREVRLDVARAICCQLAALHAPDDVRLLLCARPAALSDWEWTKWLPHMRGVESRAEAEGDAAPAVAAADLDAVVSSRAALARKVQAGADLLDSGPWLVVLADGVVPAPETVALLRRVPSRTTLVALAATRAEEPSEVDLRAEITPVGLRVERLGTAGPPAEGRADRLGPRSAEAIARRLAPLRLSEEAGTRLADTISLTAILGIGDVGALDPALAWRRRPLSDSLRAPMGVSSDGEPVLLDLKESALGGYGPHGLIIGATGSGKSELLRTIVTGLALTHPPDLLAFVLADFKGGAAFAGLQELPHVAGVITNLANDLAMIDRMHAALFGEISRRQELLRAADVASLREYQQRLTEGQPLPPLPYLLVLVDEFGELLASRPDFIDLFVAVGRLGRSLGMHLLLSSQQLDEGRLRGLEGHLSYRIAMRTFSAAESRIVLGVPDAYELPPIPGSAYLKVGTTVYTRFRAALVSQVYSPPSESEIPATRPRPFRLTDDAPAGPAIAAADPDQRAPGPTMLEVVVPQLRDAAPRVHQIWLPPLEHRIALDAVLGETITPRRQMSVPLGLVDKPAEQSRDVLVADLSGSAGHLLVVGASLTGKTTLLRTLVSSFALTHTPLEAQFYCIDYGGGGLAALAGLPHVGGVAGRNDPELVRRMVAAVASLLDDREVRFRSAGIDSPEALRSRRARLGGDGWADVFLVVDNWPALRQDFEELEAPLQEVATRGLGYGVHLVITANRWIDVRSSLRESVGGRLELRLNDPTESAINRRAAENVAKGVPGRGLTGDGLHFQVALPRIDGSVEVLDQQRGLDELVAGVAAAWKGPRAKPVLVLPRMIAIDELPAPASGDRAVGVPIGLSERDLGIVRLDLSGGEPHFLIFGDGESGKTNVLRTFLLGLMAGQSPERFQVLVIDYRRTLLGIVPPEYLLGYAGAEPAATAQLAETAQVLTRRLPPADISIERLRARSWWHGPDVYVVVDDYDLVAMPSGNPMLVLLPLLAQAKDVGLHVIVARRTGGASRGVLEPLLLRLRELGTPGLLLSGDPQEGALLGSSRSGPQPPGRGILVRRHERPSLVQIASSAPIDSSG